MVDYYELRLSPAWIERIIFWTIIIILAATLLWQVQKEARSCSEQICPEKAAEPIVETQAAPEPVLAPPAPVEEPVQEPQPQQNVEYVDMENLHFAPTELDIPFNTTVVFTNHEPKTTHTVYEIKNLFRSPRMEPGDTYNFTFNQTGNFTIQSTTGLEAGMRLKVNVYQE